MASAGGRSGPGADASGAVGGSERATLSPEDLELLAASRRGHLSTADAGGAPHVVPVCFAVLDERTLVFAIDDKPKTGRRLKRLRNFDENPRFALVVDRWDEDWSRLAYLLVSGTASACDDPSRRDAAVAALRGRYPQYAAMGLDAARHALVELRIGRVHRWKSSGVAAGG